MKKFKGYVDRYTIYSYSDIKSSGDMNSRTYAYDWILRAAISNYSDYEFASGKENKKIKNYCYDHDWNKMDEEQLIFVDDTLYICLY